MEIFYLFVSFFFFLWSIRNILFWVGLWQDKEYRRDRIFVHFRETLQGKHIFLSLGNIMKWLLLVLYIAPILFDPYLFFYQLTIGSVFILQGLSVLKDIVLRRIKRPHPTFKSMTIVFLSLILLFLLFLSPLSDIYVWLLILDRMIPLIIVFFVILFAFPTEIYQDIKIQQAIKKMQTYPNILVIAVSGSYGKSSTKEFIAQILEKKFKVTKTINSINTPIGIANTINARVNKDTQILVIEMGTDKKGDNEKICQIVKPDISVTTSVSDQHLSTFKSMENVIATEMELLHALKKDGIAILNGNNEGSVSLSQKIKKKKIIYTTEDKKIKADINAKEIKVTPDSVSFNVNLGNESFNISANLLGRHMIENMLPAIYIARYLKIPTNVIRNAAMHITPPPKTMTKKVLASGINIIDDTFNASPESVIASLDYLRLYKNKKIFVMAPIIELSKNAKNRHFDIGKKAGKICDYFFLLNKNFSESLNLGIRESKGKCQLIVARPEIAAAYIRKIAKKNDTVIFEGKESKMVLQKII